MINEIEDLQEEIERLQQIVVQLTQENLELRRQQEVGGELFADWILKWLAKKKMTVKPNTYDIYEVQVKVHIEPYFRTRKIRLKDITPNVLEQYYCTKYSEGLSGATITKHHSNIRSALKDAVKNRLILCNPADIADRPKSFKFIGNTLSSEQIDRVFSIVRNTKYFTPIYIATVMGLRRSEVLGLRWGDIDFENKTITVSHTVVRYVEDHHSKLLFSDIPKTKSSRRTLPIPNKLFEYLTKIKRKQTKLYIKKRIKYNREYLKYICVDDLGNLIKPAQLTKAFHQYMTKLNYNCRFHDLRHTCASFLIQKGVPMKSVSQWLGHSSISVTSDVYVHLFYQDKIEIANTLNELIEKKKE